MQDKYYISHAGQESGPYNISEIIEKVKTNEFSFEDYVFIDDTQEWILLINVPDISSCLPKEKPPSPMPDSKSQSEEISAPKDPFNDAEWFVLKGENRFGPFTYTDLVRMLQEKALFEYDYVWYEGMNSWSRIAEIHEFNPNQIKKLKEIATSEISEIFFRRRHARVKYGSSIIIHDNIKIWKGESIEISEGGAGIVMSNSTIAPGQTLYLHFKPGNGLPTFNAVCEVVSKQFLKNIKNENATLKYGLKFLSVNSQGKDSIKEYAKSKKSA